MHRKMLIRHDTGRMFGSSPPYPPPILDASSIQGSHSPLRSSSPERGSGVTSRAWPSPGIFPRTRDTETLLSDSRPKSELPFWMAPLTERKKGINYSNSEYSALQTTVRYYKWLYRVVKPLFV